MPVKDQLSILNLFPLYFKSEGVKVLEQFKEFTFLSKYLRNWKSKNVKYVVIFTSENVARLPENPNFSLIRISLEKLENEDFEYINGMCRQILQVLEKEAVLFLHAPENRSWADSFTSILYTCAYYNTAEVKQPNPEEAIQYVTDRDSIIVEDLVVYKFKQHLEPRYKIPELIKGLSASEHKKNPEDGFKMSPLTIRVKLLSIISTIIVVSMSLMIYYATEEFGKTMELQVKENNLNLARVRGEQAQSKLKGVLQNTAQFLASKNQESSGYFSANPEIFWVGRIRLNPQNRKMEVLRSFRNKTFLLQNNLTREDIERIHSLNQETYYPAVQGSTLVQNISPGFSLPLLAVAGPASYAGEIIILYIDGENFFKSFGKQANIGQLAQLYLVNGKGEVIAHPDIKLVLSRADMSKLPIVENLLSSRIDIGQKSYQDENEDGWVGSFYKLNFGGLGVIAASREDRIFEGVNQSRRKNLLVLIIVLNIALLVVYFFSRSLTLPIKHLVAAAHQIQEGQYNLSIKPRARDEVGLLTNAFVEMTQGLDEREKMKDAFGRFVNKEIAERVLKGDLRLGGEEKQCAVFFSDLRNFTQMSSQMTPQQVVEYLNEYFQEMVNCINLTNGIVDKFIGDAIMAHWGALYNHGNDTENAINAALMMRYMLVEFNKLSHKFNRPFTRFGCGINTGPVIAGQIGSTERFEFTVIGDAVNTASRIEALNKPLGTDILISGNSYKRVEQIFRCIRMPAVRVKGKDELLSVYGVIDRFDSPTPLQSLEEVRELVKIPKPEYKPDMISMIE